MLEQVVSFGASQGLSGIETANNSLSANTKDVMKFNMAMHDQKISSNTLLDVGSKSTDGFLQIKKPHTSNTIIKMDEAYKVIFEGLQAPPKLGSPKFDKYWNIQKTTGGSMFRSNITTTSGATDTPDFGKMTNDLIADMKESHKVSRGIMRNIREWGLKTKIWTTNVNVLTAIVGQTTTAFKTLFNSAG